MSVRSDVLELIKTRFNTIEFTSQSIQGLVYNHNKQMVQKTLSILQNEGLITKIGFKKVNNRQRFNVYCYGKRVVEKVDPVKIEHKPEWANAWPNVWAGMQRSV